MGVVLSKTSRKKKKVHLPTTGGDVFLWEYPLAGDLLGGMTIDQGGVSSASISPLEAITSLIAEWNFTDEKGSALEINVENVKLLPIGDITILAEEVERSTRSGSLSPEVKKNTASSSI